MNEAIKKYKFVTKKFNLLIAENDGEAANLLKQSIEPFFNSVFVASDGKEASELFRIQENKIDIVITDVAMPIMNGIALSKKIRETNLETPIIILSAHNDTGDYVELLKLGVKTFLTKPLSFETLLHSVYTAALQIDDARITSKYVAMLEKQVLHSKKQILKQKEEISELLQKIQEINSANNIRTLAIEPGDQDGLSDVPPDGASDYFELITMADRRNLCDALEDFANHVSLVKSDSVVDKARLRFAFLELGKVLNILKKHQTFSVLTDGIEEFSNIIAETFDAVLDSHGMMIIKLIEELAHVLDNFVLDVIKIKSPTPNYYDATILADIDAVLIAINAKATSDDSSYECELF